MALVDVPPIMWPYPLNQNSVAPNFTATGNMNASGDRFGIICQAPKSGTLDKFEIGIGTVGNNPDNGIRFSFQGVNSSGVPDGVQDQFRDHVAAISSNTWVAPGLMTDDGTDLGVKRTVTKGEFIALVIDFVSFVASDSFSLRQLRLTNVNTAGSVYFADGNSGSYTKALGSGQMIFALKYDDGTYANFSPEYVYPLLDINTYTIGSASTPDEVAQKFVIPFDCRVTGAWLFCGNTQPYDLILYDSGSSALATAPLADADFDAGVVAAYTHYFPSSVTLAAGSTYRLAFKPGASSTAVYGLVAPSSSLMGSMPWGTVGVLSSRVDAGAWTDETDEALYCGLIIDQLDDGTGSGGGGGGGSFTFVG